MMRLYKYGEMVFLMSRNANKHVVLALGVNHTDEGEIYWGFIYAPLLRIHCGETWTEL